MKEEILKWIKDFKEKETKKKDDQLSVLTGNEVQGNTHHDEFIRTMIDEGYSPSAAESAWVTFSAQGEKSGSQIEINTGGFVKSAPGLTGDFEEKFKALEDMLDLQAKSIKRYEDFFQGEQKKKEAEFKELYKLPLSEENQELIEKMDFETLLKVKPVLDMYIEEHPEIIPVDKDATELSDLNTNRVLELLGKSKEDLRNTKNDIDKMKSDMKEGAKKRMETKWGKK